MWPEGGRPQGKDHGDCKGRQKGGTGQSHSPSTSKDMLKTEHLVARTFFSVLLCLAHATLLITHACVAQICTSHFALVMFGVVCTIAHQKHSCILDVSSQSSRSSSCVIYLFLLYTTSATSDNLLHDTGEGIADWNQDPVKRNLAGGTVWPSGRLHPSHRCCFESHLSPVGSRRGILHFSAARFFGSNAWL